MEKGGTGRGNMRSSSKSHFVVIGLLVLSAFLAYSYWSQSAHNGDLALELQALRVDFRAVTDKHTKAQNQAAELSSQLKTKIEQMSVLEASLGETKQKLEDSGKETKTLKEQLQTAQDAEKLAQEKESKAHADQDKLAGELEGVKKELTDLQNAPKVCNKEECKEPVREVLTALTKSLGKTAINGALKQNGVDVMAIASDLLEGEDPAAGQGSKQEQEQ